MDNTESAVFEVHLHQKANNLDAMVQVVSLTRASAERMVLAVFFRNGNWKVTGTKKIRDLD